MAARAVVARERAAAFSRGTTMGRHERRRSTRDPGNIALAADLFRAVGGFTTAIPSATAEDKELCDRWSTSGLALAHVPTMVVHHAHDLTLAGFLRQHFNYGRGILAYRLLQRRRTASGLLPEPLTFYRDLVCSPIRLREAAVTWRSHRPGKAVRRPQVM